jgi:XisI protein
MEKIAMRQIVLQVMQELAGQSLQQQPEGAQLVLDTTNDHYLYLHLDWHDLERLYTSYVHIDIIDNLLWLQRDRTDLDVANRLVEAGIPKDQIVLAFHAPYKRKYTGFATGA